MPNPHTAEQQDRFAPANAESTVSVRRDQLPLHCPTPQSALWASHPRVFLPIDETADGRIRCPYCGTVYVLED
ncbi:Zinc finger, CHCC-type [Thioalkalivibrio nitratireducens DSM 14787]|uniref:Zinc finger, CHCC-type n=1 Tax=Thioalkalivibrio nitratireducens (strain DSM 14787 / UNIQEM 213 / ALEN2) TaxID=1255043 RepID=L0DV15_THIND|nr:zinc-finger domain-containing protein [Thioalkalivibrio nitratireducens]AGA32206.1 Zinc finger, CHCC-type [Thioalkalivibrio nitratireducens DSM 14787]